MLQLTIFERRRFGASRLSIELDKLPGYNHYSEEHRALVEDYTPRIPLIELMKIIREEADYNAHLEAITEESRSKKRSMHPSIVTPFEFTTASMHEVYPRDNSRNGEADYIKIWLASFTKIAIKCTTSLSWTCPLQNLQSSTTCQEK